MNAFLRDLEGALEVEVARAGGATGEATSVLDSVPEKRRRLVTRRRISWAGVAAAGRRGGAAIAIAALTAARTPRAAPTESAGGTTDRRSRRATDFDPEGDGEEHPRKTGSRTTATRRTAWSTEDYTTGLDGPARTASASTSTPANR